MSKWIMAGVIFFLLATNSVFFLSSLSGANQLADQFTSMRELAEFHKQFMKQNGIAIERYQEEVEHFAERNGWRTGIELYAHAVNRSVAESASGNATGK